MTNPYNLTKDEALRLTRILRGDKQPDDDQFIDSIEQRFINAEAKEAAEEAARKEGDPFLAGFDSGAIKQN